MAQVHSEKYTVRNTKLTLKVSIIKAIYSKWDFNGVHGTSYRAHSLFQNHVSELEYIEGFNSFPRSKEYFKIILEYADGVLLCFYEGWTLQGDHTEKEKIREFSDS